VFHGSWSETMRQLGNAVPVALGRVVAASVAESLINKKLRDCITYVQPAARAA
jgi:DNA (cytosine-5)-methyltransferase 1